MSTLNLIILKFETYTIFPKMLLDIGINEKKF